MIKLGVKYIQSLKKKELYQFYVLLFDIKVFLVYAVAMKHNIDLEKRGIFLQLTTWSLTNQRTVL